jgi:Tfp pilus assembly protein PilO
VKKVFKNLKYERYYKELLPYIKKEKNQQYFAVILTLGASIFFALFAINPTLSTISKLKKEVEDRKFAESMLTAKINSLSSLSTEYEIIERDLELVYDAVPKEPEAPTLIAQIQSVAQETGVNITSVRVSPINLSQNQTAKSSSFEFEITGTSELPSIQEFSTRLTTIGRIVDIQNVSITESNGEQNLQISIKGLAYYKKE